MTAAALGAAHGIAVTPAHQFSVRQIPWLPILTHIGLEHVGLDEALERAHEIKSIESRDPIVRGALNRFLVSISVLVSRVADVDTKSAPSIALSGFDPEDVATALDAIDDQLWLVHSSTPFMQLPILDDLYEASDNERKRRVHASELLPRTPGSAGKVWFDAPGDAFNTTSLSPEEATLALIAHWFYSPKSNTEARESMIVERDGEEYEEHLSWRHLGTVGTAGLDAKRSLTFWHRGSTLAEFLLLNTARHWLEETSVPAWASPYTTAHPADSLAEHTFSGNAAMLTFDPSSGSFPLVVRGGFPNGTNVSSAKEAGNEQLAAAAAADPSRVWQDVITGKTESERRMFKGFALTNSTAQNLKAWFIEAAQPTIKHGVLMSRTRELEVLYMEAAVKFRIPSITAAGWMSFNSSHLEVDAVAKELVTELAETTARRPEEALARAIKVVHPPVGSPAKFPDVYWSTLDRAVGVFHSELEPIIGHAVEQVIAGDNPEALIGEIREAQIAAFDDAVVPFLHARTLPSIAQGRSTLTGPPKSLGRRGGRGDDNVTVFVARFIRQSQTDTRFRVALSRGLHEATTSDAAAILDSPRGIGDLPQAERLGVTRAFGLLATHAGAQHLGGRRLSNALAYLTRLKSEPFNGESGISAKVGMLPFLELEEAVAVLDGLLARIARTALGVSHHDVVHTLRFWQQDDFESQTAHRNSLAYEYHSAFQKAAA